MKIINYTLSLIAIIVFFILATATSRDEDFAVIELQNMEVEVLDASLILSNNDTIDIQNAFLSLSHNIEEINNNGISVRVYIQDNYNLAIGQIDTIPFSTFKTGSDSFPNDSIPTFFYLNFLHDNYEVVFNKEL